DPHGERRRGVRRPRLHPVGGAGGRARLRHRHRRRRQPRGTRGRVPAQCRAGGARGRRGDRGGWRRPRDGRGRGGGPGRRAPPRAARRTRARPRGRARRPPRRPLAPLRRHPAPGAPGAGRLDRVAARRHGTVPLRGGHRRPDPRRRRRVRRGRPARPQAGHPGRHGTVPGAHVRPRRRDPAPAAVRAATAAGHRRQPSDRHAGAVGRRRAGGSTSVTARKPWQGIVVAIPTLFREDLSVDLDRVQEHVRWLAEQGCHGVAPCGSLGEYQTLSDAERADVVRAAVEAAPPGFSVVAGVGGYGSHQSRRWAEQAAQAGAHAVLALPPNNYRAQPAGVGAHYREVAAVGLPVVTYNNSYDTKVDLTPELLATVAEIDGIVAVKEFSGDVRRLHRIRDLCPHIDVIVGADDVLLELVLCGAKGWIAGFPNALPAVSRRLYDLCASRDVDAALALYAELFPIFTWDTKPVFVQAIKLAMEMAGR